MKRLFIWRTECDVLIAFADNKEDAKKAILAQTKEIDPWSYELINETIENLHELTRKEIIYTLNNQEPFTLIVNDNTDDFSYVISHGNQ
jgi:hypothetical protein